MADETENTENNLFEYELLRAEWLRRNAEFRKEAAGIKREWGNHVTKHGSYRGGFKLSNEYVAFCSKWNLRLAPDCFLELDITKPLNKYFFKNHKRYNKFYFKKLSSDGFYILGSGKREAVIEPKPGKLYLEIDMLITKKSLAMGFKYITDKIAKERRSNEIAIKQNYHIVTWKENLKIYDMRERGLTYDKIAQEPGIGLGSENTLRKKRERAKKEIEAMSKIINC